MPDIVRFDLESALAFTGDDRELLREIITIFIDNAPAMISGMRSGLDTADHEIVVRTAHTLKGESRTVGAVQCSIIAAEIENRARLGELESLEEIIDSLRMEIHLFQKDAGHAI